MLRTSVGLCVCLLLICSAVLMWAQQPVAVATGGSNTVVPSLVSYSGALPI